MNRPELTMIIANRNGARFLRAAVLSLLAEQIDSLEIIVVDDGSQDISRKKIWDLPVRWIALGSSRGQAFAQNVGIEEAHGRYIGFLDADDLLVPGGLRARWRFLLENPAAVVMGEIGGIIDARGKYQGPYAEAYHKPLPRRLTWEAYREGRYHVPSQSWLRLYRREALREVGSFDPDLICAHDHDHLCRTLKKFPMAILPVPAVYYRLHNRNLSGRFQTEGFRIYPKFRAETFYVNVRHGVRVE